MKKIVPVLKNMKIAEVGKKTVQNLSYFLKYAAVRARAAKAIMIAVRKTIMYPTFLNMIAIPIKKFRAI